jgi:ABC-type antimicrobial peptide transport system permease subunit
MEEQYRLRGVNVLGVTTTTVGAIGIMGLTLAIVGLYGLVAYAVSRRTREIGIRLALGAARGDVFRMVLTQGMALAMTGLGAGLLASLAATRAMRVAFPGAPHRDGSVDVVAFGMVTLTVLVVTLLAAYVPARRAAHISPTLALRSE